MNTLEFVALAFCVGFACGVLLDDAWDLYREQLKETHMRKLSIPRPRRPSFRQVAAFGLVLAVVMQLAVGAMLIFTRLATDQYARCTAQWQQQFGSAYAARIDASTEVSTAIDDIVTSVGAEDQTAFREAVTRYLAVRAQQDKDRAQNPYPPLPQALCGNPTGGPL